MPTSTHTRKFSLAMLVIIVMIAVVVPVCMMVECDMDPGHSMGAPLFGFSSECVRTMTSDVQAAVETSGLPSLIMTLVAVLGIASVIGVPPRAVHLVRVTAQVPHEPPQDPRGVRLTI